MRSPNYLTAVAIGITDLERSVDFYSRILGMKQTQKITLDEFDEIVIVHEGRSSVTLVHYTDGVTHNFKDNPTRLVFYVTDPVGIANRIRAEGLEITREPAPVPVGVSETLTGIVIGIEKDPDGHLIELVDASAAAKLGNAYD